MTANSNSGERRPQIEVIAKGPSPPTGQGVAAVYLVHGTWSTDAPWTNADSALCKAVTSCSPGVRVLRMRWTGKNRNHDREAAAKFLAAELDANPDTPTVLIGHSHGGNVAHSALLHAQARQHLRGVVCLNTPFFTVMRRNVQSRLVAFFWFWMFGGMCALGVLVRANPRLFTLVSAAWVGGLVMAIWASRNPKWLRDRQDRLLRKLAPARAPYLCLTNQDDEAFGFLSTVEALGNLPALLISPWLLWIYMFVAMALVACGVLPSVGPSDGGWWPKLGAIAQSTYLWAAALYFVPFSLASVAGFFSLGAAQGLWDPLATYLVRSLVTLVPHSAGHTEFRELEVGPGSELAHSALYKNAVVCDDVAKWVAAQLHPDIEPASRREK